LSTPASISLSEGGKLYEQTKEVAEAVGFYENICKPISAIQAAA
jgi:hypothetical protein